MPAPITDADRINMLQGILRQAAQSKMSRGSQLEAQEAAAMGGMPQQPMPMPQAPPQAAMPPMGAASGPMPSIGGTAAGDPRMNPAAAAKLAEMLRRQAGAVPP